MIKIVTTFECGGGGGGGSEGGNATNTGFNNGGFVATSVKG